MRHTLGVYDLELAGFYFTDTNNNQSLDSEDKAFRVLDEREVSFAEANAEVQSKYGIRDLNGIQIGSDLTEGLRLLSFAQENAESNFDLAQGSFEKALPLLRSSQVQFTDEFWGSFSSFGTVDDLKTEYLAGDWHVDIQDSNDWDWQYAFLAPAGMTPKEFAAQAETRSLIAGGQTMHKGMGVVGRAGLAGFGLLALGLGAKWIGDRFTSNPEVSPGDISLFTLPPRQTWMGDFEIVEDEVFQSPHDKDPFTIPDLSPKVYEEKVEPSTTQNWQGAFLASAGDDEVDGVAVEDASVTEGAEELGFFERLLDGVLSLFGGKGVEDQKAVKSTNPMDAYREDEREELLRILTQAQPGDVIVLAGQSGLGKSTTADEAMRQLGINNFIFITAEGSILNQKTDYSDKVIILEISVGTQEALEAVLSYTPMKANHVVWFHPKPLTNDQIAQLDKERVEVFLDDDGNVFFRNPVRDGRYDPFTRQHPTDILVPEKTNPILFRLIVMLRKHPEDSLRNGRIVYLQEKYKQEGSAAELWMKSLGGLLGVNDEAELAMMMYYVIRVSESFWLNGLMPNDIVEIVRFHFIAHLFRDSNWQIDTTSGYSRGVEINWWSNYSNSGGLKEYLLNNLSTQDELVKEGYSSPLKTIIWELNHPGNMDGAYPKGRDYLPEVNAHLLEQLSERGVESELLDFLEQPFSEYLEAQNSEDE